MDSASSLAYPGGRILAGWCRQLQPHRPTALWVGYLFVHRVEALVESIEPRPVDALALHVLGALAVDQRDSPHVHAADPLPGRLHLPAPAVQQLLRSLQGQDLVRRCEPGCWCLSERGQSVLKAQADLAPRRERRTFPFVERLSSAGRRLTPPHFLPLAECATVPWEVGDGHRFDVALLAQSVEQPAAWRERYGFPDVHRVITVSESEPNGVWERVIVDRPERVLIALALGADQTLLGFAVEADGWKLHHEAPVLRLSESARDALPDLTVLPAAWEESWRLGCRQRHLPQSDADACRLRFDGIHLDVQAPEVFVERLRTAKSDLLREESGLLAGDGYLRAVALLRLQAK